VRFEQAGLVADLGHEGFADAAAADRNLELIVSATRFDASDEGCEQRNCKCATPHWFLPQAAKVPRPILQPHGQERIEDEPREQDQPRIAVGLEHDQAVEGIVDVEPDDLPGEVRGKGE